MKDNQNQALEIFSIFSDDDCFSLVLLTAAEDVMRKVEEAGMV